MVLAHITFCTPYVVLSVMPRLKKMNQNVYEAAPVSYTHLPCSEAVRERNMLTKANSVFSVATGSPSLKMRRVYFFFNGTIKEKPPSTALFPRSL